MCRPLPFNIESKLWRLRPNQYKAREVTSGWHYLAFAQECTLAYSKLFAEIILSHLVSCGVKFRDSRLQTDNGCEFVGNWQAKADSKFTEAVGGSQGAAAYQMPAARPHLAE